MSITSILFFHVCEVMSQTSAVDDQLFVMAIEAVNQVPLVSDCAKDEFKNVFKRLREAVLAISHQVYKEVLLKNLDAYL